MRILGFDPGLATVGYGVIESDGRNNVAVDYGVIKTAVRLAMIDAAAAELMDRFRPDAVAVEELFFNTNITTGIRVAEARGVLLVCAVKLCGNLFEYTPLQIKQAMVGYGRADKRQVQQMVRVSQSGQNSQTRRRGRRAGGCFDSCADEKSVRKFQNIGAKNAGIR